MQLEASSSVSYFDIRVHLIDFLLKRGLMGFVVLALERRFLPLDHLEFFDTLHYRVSRLRIVLFTDLFPRLQVVYEF